MDDASGVEAGRRDQGKARRSASANVSLRRLNTVLAQTVPIRRCYSGNCFTWLAMEWVIQIFVFPLLAPFSSPPWTVWALEAAAEVFAAYTFVPRTLAAIWHRRRLASAGAPCENHRPLSRNSPSTDM